MTNPFASDWLGRKRPASIFGPGGVSLPRRVSYHPSPVDYWRWTHEGLRRLFEQNAEWASLAVIPAAGTASALAMLIGTYVEIALRRTIFARPPIWVLNKVGHALDTRSSRFSQPVPGSLIPNLHVVALP